MKRALLALSLSVALTGCAVDQQAPNLTGPSELGLSVALAATPDSILQNGSAQSTVSIVVRDSNGNGVAGQSFYVQTKVGTTLNIGSLSSSAVTTDSQGRAVVVFTAPAADAGSISTVSVEFIPVSSGAASGMTRVILIKLVRP